MKTEKSKWKKGKTFQKNKKSLNTTFHILLVLVAYKEIKQQLNENLAFLLLCLWLLPQKMQHLRTKKYNIYRKKDNKI